MKQSQKESQFGVGTDEHDCHRWLRLKNSLSQVIRAAIVMRCVFAGLDTVFMHSGAFAWIQCLGIESGRWVNVAHMRGEDLLQVLCRLSRTAG